MFEIGKNEKGIASGTVKSYLKFKSPGQGKIANAELSNVPK